MAASLLRFCCSSVITAPVLTGTSTSVGWDSRINALTEKSALRYWLVAKVNNQRLLRGEGVILVYILIDELKDNLFIVIVEIVERQEGDDLPAILVV